MTNTIAIQGFGSYSHEGKYYFQSAAGFFRNNGKNKVIELYGGFGYGLGDAYIDANPGFLDGKYQLYFMQFNYGKISSASSNLEMGIAIKSGYLHSELLDNNFYDGTIFPLLSPRIRYYDESLLIEPGCFIRFGSEKVKFNIKAGSSFIYKFTNKDKYIPYNFINLGFGLNFRL